MLYLICYDIACPRRRRRVVRLLEGHGQRLHESAFAARLRDCAVGSLQRRLLALLHPEEDRLRVYPLCARDAPDRLTVVGAPTADPPTHVVL